MLKLVRHTTLYSVRVTCNAVLLKVPDKWEYFSRLTVTTVRFLTK
jgi:hypothetical protein